MPPASPVRVTPTRAGLDSAGRMQLLGLELEGRTYLGVVAGAALSFLVYLGSAGSGLGAGGRLLLAAVPLTLALALLRWLVIGRPPGYAADVVDGWLDGPHAFHHPHRWRRRPHPVHGPRPSPHGGSRGRA